jgi:D-3-phosphoglycerate dehydrogenase / 2-oxoglutarate reductase
MARWNILISAPAMQLAIERFRLQLESAGCNLLIPHVQERLGEQELLEIIGGIDGAICGDDAFTARVLESAPKLKVLSKWGTGIDSIDLDAALTHGIAIKNTPNAFSEPVADSVYAYILYFARQISSMDRAMRAGQWQQAKKASLALQECTLGVIGVGDIGKAVIRRAKGFGMRVLGNDIKPINPEFINATGITMVNKDLLLMESDFVTIHCDLNPTSIGLMNDARFALMKSSAYLINTARGSIVEEAALVRALNSNSIAGAALDVFEKEPLAVDSPLRLLDNVLLAPHNANSSAMAWEKVHQNTLKNLLEELQKHT